MALSFGKGKKGDAASNPTNGARGGAGEEILDESWFETAFEEEAGAPDAPAAAAAPASQPMAADDEPNFDIFADLEAPSRPSAAAPAPAPATAAFGIPDTAPMATTPFASDEFTSAEPSLTHYAPDATPFDVASPGAGAEAEAPAKAKGGLKKLLPVLGLLIVVGGGGFFWYSQQGSGTDESEGTVSPPHGMGAEGHGMGVEFGSTRPGTQLGDHPGAMPPSVPPSGAHPAKPAPGTKPPKPGKLAPVAAPESPIQHDIGKLWFEGANAKHAGNKALALKKWRDAIKLARSKPGHEQSATMIQQAIDKLK